MNYTTFYFDPKRSNDYQLYLYGYLYSYRSSSILGSWSYTHTSSFTPVSSTAVNIDLNGMPALWNYYSRNARSGYIATGHTVGSYDDLFYGLSQLQTVTNINADTVGVANMFSGCSNLTTVLDLPQNISGLYYTFRGCTNLTTIPSIPNKVRNLAYTFYMGNVPSNLTIPNDITNMVGTFAKTNATQIPAISTNASAIDSMCSGCTQLTTAPVIPSSVNTMYSTFAGCTNLTGDIYIYSNKVWEVRSCFNNTSLTKNVYIPFTYENGEYTKTYNYFTEVYTTDGSVNGVYLKDTGTH